MSRQTQADQGVWQFAYGTTGVTFARNAANTPVFLQLQRNAPSTAARG